MISAPTPFEPGASSARIIERLNGARMTELFASRKEGAWGKEKQACSKKLTPVDKTNLSVITPEARDSGDYVTRVDMLLLSQGIQPKTSEFNTAAKVMGELIMKNRPDVVAWMLKAYYPEQFTQYEKISDLKDAYLKGDVVLPDDFAKIDVLGAFDQCEWVGHKDEKNITQTPLAEIVTKVAKAVRESEVTPSVESNVSSRAADASAQTLDLEALAKVARENALNQADNIRKKVGLPTQAEADILFRDKSSSLLRKPDVPKAEKGFIDQLKYEIGGERGEKIANDLAVRLGALLNSSPNGLTEVEIEKFLKEEIFIDGPDDKITVNGAINYVFTGLRTVTSKTTHGPYDTALAQFQNLIAEYAFAQREMNNNAPQDFAAYMFNRCLYAIDHPAETVLPRKIEWDNANLDHLVRKQILTNFLTEMSDIYNTRPTKEKHVTNQLKNSASYMNEGTAASFFAFVTDRDGKILPTLLATLNSDNSQAFVDRLSKTDTRQAIVGDDFYYELKARLEKSGYEFKPKRKTKHYEIKLKGETVYSTDSVKKEAKFEPYPEREKTGLPYLLKDLEQSFHAAEDPYQFLFGITSERTLETHADIKKFIKSEDYKKIKEMTRQGGSGIGSLLKVCDVAMLAYERSTNLNDLKVTREFLFSLMEDLLAPNALDIDRNQSRQLLFRIIQMSRLYHYTEKEGLYDQKFAKLSGGFSELFRQADIAKGEATDKLSSLFNDHHESRIFLKYVAEARKPWIGKSFFYEVRGDLDFQGYSIKYGENHYKLVRKQDGTEKVSAASSIDTQPVSERIKAEKKAARGQLEKEGFPDDLIEHALNHTDFPKFIAGLRAFNFSDKRRDKLETFMKMDVRQRESYLFSDEVNNSNPFSSEAAGLTHDKMDWSKIPFKVVRKERPEVFVSLAKYVLKQAIENPKNQLAQEIAFHFFYYSPVYSDGYSSDLRKEVIGTSVDLLTTFLKNHKAPLFGDQYLAELNSFIYEDELGSVRRFSGLLIDKDEKLRPEVIEVLNSRPEFLKLVADAVPKKQQFFAEVRKILEDKKSGVKIYSKAGGGYELQPTEAAQMADVLTRSKK